MKSSRQLNAHIRAMSEKIQVAPQILLRFYLMENLLERISASKYRRHFILKGGMLVASMVGLKTRSTMTIIKLGAVLSEIDFQLKNIANAFASHSRSTLMSLRAKNKNFLSQLDEVC